MAGVQSDTAEGDILLARMTSSTLRVVTVARSEVVHGVNIGGDAVAVAVRTPAISESMKSLLSPGENRGIALYLVLPRRLSTILHKRLADELMEAE